MWEAIELREIRVFLTLAEELHFGRSAERLGLTQSRVSQSLRELEAKLGGQLVHRTSRRVQLTPLGEQLRDEVTGTYTALTATLERIGSLSRRGSEALRVATFSGPAAGPHFIKIVRAFRERFPDRAVALQQAGRPAQMLNSLRQGDVDVMASWLPIGDRTLVIGPTLATEPRVLAVSANHALAGRSAVSLEDIGDHRVLRLRGLPREMHEAWVPSRTPSGRRIPSERVDPDTLGDSIIDVGYLVASGRIVHPTVPSAAMAWDMFDIVYVPISDMPPLRSALIWRRNARDATLREFIRTAPEVLRAADGRGASSRAGTLA